MADSPVLSRVKNFRRWFASLPQRAIDLNVVLVVEKPRKFAALPVKNKYEMTKAQALDCGSVGCVMGWLKVSPVFKRFVKVEGLNPHWDDTLFKFMGQDQWFSGVFAPRNKRDVSPRKEALNRLDKVIESLK